MQPVTLDLTVGYGPTEDFDVVLSDLVFGMPGAKTRLLKTTPSARRPLVRFTVPTPYDAATLLRRMGMSEEQIDYRLRAYH